MDGLNQRQRGKHHGHTGLASTPSCVCRNSALHV
jgi:hypothetical protein